MRRVGNKPRGFTGRVDQDLAGRQQQRVAERVRAGRTEESARDIGLEAMLLAEQLINLIESQGLPRPIVCEAGCHYCCYNLVEVTPPEALVIGDYITQTWGEDAKEELRQRLAGSRRLKAGKSRMALAGQRQKLPCPLLREGRCMVYPVRPLVCRAMHSLDVARCKEEFKCLKPRVEYYAHRGDLAASVAAGLLEGCRGAGCPSGVLELTQALIDFFREERPLMRWIKGEAVFRFTS